LIVGERYPGYNVLSKRNSPSWNEQTRRVVDERLAIQPDAHRFLEDREFLTLQAVCARIIPQPGDRAQPAPLAAMIDQKLEKDSREGYRDYRLPPQREAWRRGLRALEAEALQRHGKPFHQLEVKEQDTLLTAVQKGAAHDAAWGDMPPQIFFKKRLLHDIASSYYAHPVSWNEIGFGGPASPRGYVRLDYDRRDPWEAAEAHPGRVEAARWENFLMGKDPFHGG
jgi:hypothetical protein